MQDGVEILSGDASKRHVATTIAAVRNRNTHYVSRSARAEYSDIANLEIQDSYLVDAAADANATFCGHKAAASDGVIDFGLIGYMMIQCPLSEGI